MFIFSMFKPNSAYSEDELVHELQEFKSELFLTLNHITEDKNNYIRVSEVINMYDMSKTGSDHPDNQGKNETTDELEGYKQAMEKIPHELLEGSKRLGSNNLNILFKKNDKEIR